MLQYIIRRCLMMFVTLFGITVITFVVINLAPGGPVEQRLQAMRFGGGVGGRSSSRGDAVVSDEVLQALKKQYGFDKPLHVRYAIWINNLIHLDFGDSFTYEEPVTQIILSKFPVSLQFGFFSLLLTYLICIPLGVMMAIRDGSALDRTSGILLFIAYSIPPLIMGIWLITFLAGGSFLNIFPIGRLYSDNYADLTFWGKVGDRVHHFILPLTCFMIGNFASLTLLMKNSMLEVIRLDFIRTARAKGLSDKVVYFKHALRNALIPIATGLSGFLGLFFTGSLIIEQMFQLDGIGLLTYNAVLQRDYNLLMGIVFLDSLALLVGRLISDLSYVFIDPRIDFS